uniref:Uncharacterized protein n=2 Tax=Eukaryota TaxID=2759 RepID=A0A7S2Z0R7_9CHLO|mmetsp:Transcript_13181/g.34064  ORF Transcript_13181/g.34064 Transcript_13181/m.34064 type:complete len:149 (+) Transcript_13181:98-544(+)
MSLLGYLEAARRRGTLDVAFGNRLLGGEGERSGEAILQELIHNYAMQQVNALSNDSGRSIGGSNLRTEVAPIMMICLFVCLGSRDTKGMLKWLRGNRLAPYSIPQYKSHHVQDLKKMVREKFLIDLSTEKEKQIRLMIERLESALTGF